MRGEYKVYTQRYLMGSMVLIRACLTHPKAKETVFIYYETYNANKLFWDELPGPVMQKMAVDLSKQLIEQLKERKRKKSIKIFIALKP